MSLKRVQILIPEDTYEWLTKQVSDEGDLSISSYIRRLITKERQKNENE